MRRQGQVDHLIERRPSRTARELAAIRRLIPDDPVGAFHQLRASFDRAPPETRHFRLAASLLLGMATAPGVIGRAPEMARRAGWIVADNVDMTSAVFARAVAALHELSRDPETQRKAPLVAVRAALNALSFLPNLPSRDLRPALLDNLSGLARHGDPRVARRAAAGLRQLTVDDVDANDRTLRSGRPEPD